MNRRVLPYVLVLSVCTGAVASAGAEAPRSLQQLLQEVRKGWRTEHREDVARETKFRNAKEERGRMLEEARATRAAEETRSAVLERAFEENERTIAELQKTLRERLGTLGEAFGVVRQGAGDTRAHLRTSVTSAQLGDRDAPLGELARSTALPSVEALEQLWFILLQEMTESGKVVRFPATVVAASGSETTAEVIRVGTFNVFTRDRYLRWLPEVGKLAELGRQPGSRRLRTLRRFWDARVGLTPLSIDPSRGAILSLLVETASARERIEQGGVIGYIIIVLGILAGLLGLARLGYVVVVNRRVDTQRRAEEVLGDNPLGRVLHVYEENPNADAETLELKLDEAVLRESNRLDRFLWLVKVVSVVAPLLGLLGTVTGMIRVFQVIVLFGAGDPKLMAGGIAEALVTTMLGLCVAVPLLLIHALAASGSRKVVSVLEEQSVGLVALRAEGSGGGA